MVEISSGQKKTKQANEGVEIAMSAEGTSLQDVLTEQSTPAPAYPTMPQSEEEFGAKEKYKPIIEVLQEQATEMKNKPLPEFGRDNLSENQINRQEAIREQYKSELDHTLSGESSFVDPATEYGSGYRGTKTPFGGHIQSLIDQQGVVADGSRSHSTEAWGDYWNEPKGEEEKWHRGTLRMLGEGWMGGGAGVMYGADALVQTFADAANLASDDPQQDVRVFSILGDLIMQGGGPAKDMGRDIARMSLFWFPAFKLVKWLGSVVGKGARFISGAKGVMEAKKYRLGQFLGKDIPAGALAQWLNGFAAYKSTERGPGGAMMQSMDKWFSENLGTPYIAEYFAEDDPTKGKHALSRLYNAFGEMFLQIGLDKVLLPAVKSAAVKASEMHKYVPDAIKDRLVKIISLEKHMLAFDKRATTGSQGKAGTYVIVNENGRITTVPRGDGTMEIVRSGNVVEKSGKIKIKQHTRKTPEGEEIKGTYYFEVPPNMPAEEGLRYLNETFHNGTLADMLSKARTFDERMVVLQELSNHLHTLSSTGKSSKTFEAMLKESDDVIDKLWGWDKAAMLSRKKGSPVNEAIGVAYARVAESSFNEMVLAIQNLGRMSARGGGGQMASGKDAFNELFRTLHNYSAIRQQYEDVFSVAGRTLGVKRWAKGHHDDILESPEFARIMAKEDGASMDDVMRFAAVLSESYLRKGKKGLTKAIEEFGKSGYTDAFYQGYIGTGLLLTPSLWVLNTATGMANVGVQVGSRQFAAIAGKVFGRGDVKMGEALAGTVGLTAGIVTALRAATSALVTGKSFRAFQGSKMESWATGRLSLSSKTLGIENNVQGLGVDALGKGAFFGERALLTGDTLVKVFSSYTEIYMSAYRKAMTSLAEGGHKWGQKGTYERFTTLFQDIIENPRSYSIDGKTIFERGVEQGKLNTFQKELGDLAKVVQQLQTKTVLAPVFKLWVPFIKVLSNIPKFFVQNTPAGLLNPGFKKWQGKNSIYKKGVPDSHRMEEAGRMTLGAMLVAFGAILYNNGSLRGHPEPEGFGEGVDWRLKKQKRAVGRPDMAILHTDSKGNKHWVDMKKFQPYSDILAFGADFAKIATNETSEEASEVLWQMVTASKEALVNTSWVPNLQKIMEIFNDRAEPHKYKQILYSLQAPFQLAPLRSFRKSDVTRGGNIPPDYLPYSLTLENQEEGKLFDMSSLAARWKTGIAAHGQIPDLDWRGRVNTSHDTEASAKKGVTPFGLPDWLTTGMMSFMPVHKDKADKLDLAIEDLGVVFAKPNDVVYDPVSKRATKMLPWEYYYFRMAIGKIRDSQGDRLEDKLKKVMGLGGHKIPKIYKKAPRQQAGTYPADRYELVKAVYNAYVKLAREYMIYATKKDGSPSDIKIRLDRMAGEIDLSVDMAEHGKITQGAGGQLNYTPPDQRQIQQFKTDYRTAEDRFPNVPRQSSRGVAGDNR